MVYNVDDNDGRIPWDSVSGMGSLVNFKWSPGPSNLSSDALSHTSADWSPPPAGFHKMPSSVARLTSLIYLHNNGMRYVTIPTELCSLTQLIGLSLANSRLSSLPSCIARMTDLNSLRVRDNRLESLPPQLGRLSQLDFLNLYNNRLSAGALDASTWPPNVDTLDIGLNNIDRWPSWIDQSTKLRSLRAQWNPALSTIPRSFLSRAQQEARSNSGKYHFLGVEGTNITFSDVVEVFGSRRPSTGVRDTPLDNTYLIVSLAKTPTCTGVSGSYQTALATSTEASVLVLCQRTTCSPPPILGQESVAAPCSNLSLSSLTTLTAGTVDDGGHGWLTTSELNNQRCQLNCATPGCNFDRSDCEAVWSGLGARDVWEDMY